MLRIIAELGIAHEGSRATWRRLIDAAFAAGADYIKGQWWSSPARMAQHRGGNLALFERYQLPLEWLEDIPPLSRMCTVYLPEDIPVIAPLVTAYKIGSYESRDWDFLAAHLNLDDGKGIFVSTGGWTHEELANRYGQGLARLNYLHCVSAYPVPVDQIQLGCIRHYGLAGLSDHTADIYMGANAVLAGARWLEAHLTLADGRHPDMGASLVPQDFAAYAEAAREATLMLGDGYRMVTEDERWIRGASA